MLELAAGKLGKEIFKTGNQDYRNIPMVLNEFLPDTAGPFRAEMAALQEVERQRLTHLVQVFSTVIFGVDVMALLITLLVLINNRDSFSLSLVFLSLLNIIISLISYKLAAKRLHRGAAQLLLFTNALSLAYAYFLIGTDFLVPLLIVLNILIAAILLQTIEVILLTTFWIIVCVFLFYFQNNLKLYQPPINFSQDLADFCNLVFLTVSLPSIAVSLLVPARSLTNVLKSRSQRLEKLLEQQFTSDALLHETEQRLKATFDQLSVGITYVRRDGQCLLANRKLAEMFGYSQAELPGLNFVDLTYPADRAKGLLQFEELWQGKLQNYSQDKRYIRKDGSLLWCNTNTSPVTGVDDQPKYFITVVIDITERKQAEAQVFFQASLLDQVHNAVVATDMEGKIIYWNKFAESFYQITADEMHNKDGQVFTALESYNSPDLHQEIYRSLMEKGVWEGEYLVKRNDGSVMASHLIVTILKNSNGEMIGTVGVSVDITERKQVAEALAAEKERLAVTLRSIGEGVITTDTEGRVVLLNPVAEKFTGWSQAEAAGRLLPEVFHIIDEKNRKVAANPAEYVLRTGEITGLANQTMLVSRDGYERYVSNNCAPIRDRTDSIKGVVLVFRDITARQRVEAELRKVQKLESLGLLAGGIAHDFNNILTAIGGNISLAKMDVPSNGSAFEVLDEAEKATFRAKDLTQQLLTFSQGGAPIKKIASLKDLVESSVKFALRGSNVQPVFQIAEDLWPVEIDSGQINQVLNNLVINADQAMPGGGLLTIEARNISRSALDRALNLPGEAYVQLQIKDQGLGIPAKNLTRIFDPYFTTKQKGSGLGLASCFSIIARHEGTISVESELGKGSIFTINLPATPGKFIQEDVKVTEIKTGKGKILLMDDEEMILELSRRLLERLGYQIEVARDGLEAVETYRQAMQQQQPFDLVIMDLTVKGGMGGKEAIIQLKNLDPAVKAIVSSGYSNDPIMANYQAYHFKEVLSKPFRVEELTEKIEKVMEII